MQRELDERRAQITEALGDLEMNAAASLEAMLAMLRVRDAHSYDHAHRVAALSVNLAMALRVSEPQLSDIERAALLHNLGRLALPDRSCPSSAWRSSIPVVVGALTMFQLTSNAT